MFEDTMKFVGLRLFAATVRGALTAHKHYKKAPISYKELTDVVAGHEQGSLAQALAVITDEDHKNGRPLLASLVISSATQWPGSGYFAQCSKLGYRVIDNPRFWPMQLERLGCAIKEDETLRLYLADIKEYNDLIYSAAAVREWNVVDGEGVEVTNPMTWGKRPPQKVNGMGFSSTRAFERREIPAASNTRAARTDLPVPPKGYKGPVSKYRETQTKHWRYIQEIWGKEGAEQFRAQFDPDYKAPSAINLEAEVQKQRELKDRNACDTDYPLADFNLGHDLDPAQWEKDRAALPSVEEISSMWRTEPDVSKTFDWHR